MHRSLTIRLSLLAVIGLVFAPVTTTDGREPATLEAVDLTRASAESCRIVLRIDGRVDRVDGSRLEDGRFVLDLAPVVWNGLTRRVRPDIPGVFEYRFSQFSRNPPVARLVVEVDSGWSCRHDLEPGGLVVACSRPAAAEAPVIAVVRGIPLTSPVAGLDARGLIDRSLGYTPRDIVRDGLPNFGAMRDDWKGAPRPHKGLDIYIDKTPVLAVADGEVVGTGVGERAGGWAKINHHNGVETVYVHISRIAVENGERVAAGRRIAFIDGAVGNAVEPQLHFEIRLDGQSVDPVPFIYEEASGDLQRRITWEQERLEALANERAQAVADFAGR